MSQPNQGLVRRGFSLIELLVAIAVITILGAVLVPSLQHVRRFALRAECASNLRQFTMADILHRNEKGSFPDVNAFVPSTMTQERLEIVAKYFDVTVPLGPIRSWPKRPQLPKWMTCPLAHDSGYAEGMTVGGGDLYRIRIRWWN